MNECLVTNKHGKDVLDSKQSDVFETHVKTIFHFFTLLHKTVTYGKLQMLPHVLLLDQ